MKNITSIIWMLIITLTGMTTNSAFSQIDQGRGNLQERIDAQRVAFITEKVNLTPEEAQVFWPLYNRYRNQLEGLRAARTPDKDLIDMTDAEATAYIDEMLRLEQEETALKVSFVQDLKPVLSSRKILRYYRAEKMFKEKLLEALQRRRNR